MLFDGMAAALNSVFGAAVVLVDLTTAQTSVQGVFRFVTVEADSADGRSTLVNVPTFRVQKTAAPGIAAGWIVKPAAYNPRQFRVLRVDRGSSPAADAFIVCVLEEI